VRKKYGYTHATITAIEPPDRKRSSAEAFGAEPKK
jgi:hypothetical protein